MKLIQFGDTFKFGDLSEAHNSLPVGTYMLKFDQIFKQYYLVKKDDFQLPSKVYGDHSIVSRWLKSFEKNSQKNMGILLSGMKGSGKTITAQKFCIESGRPVILITQPHHGEEFVDFVTRPEFNNCILFIDEFEKVYNRDTQQDLLSLMDGNFDTKLIFLLTINEFNINDYLINRLNRIKYRKHYTSLEEDVINQVIDDMLIIKEHKQSIFDFFDKVNMCTFDLLVNIIKEMNLFEEDALACGKHLNLKEADKNYNVYEIVEGKDHPCWNIHGAILSKAQFSVERRKTDYLPNQEEALWEIEFHADEYKLTRKPGSSSFVIYNPDTKTSFRFVEQRFGEHSMIF